MFAANIGQIPVKIDIKDARSVFTNVLSQWAHTCSWTNFGDIHMNKYYITPYRKNTYYIHIEYCIRDGAV